LIKILDKNDKNEVSKVVKTIPSTYVVKFMKMMIEKLSKSSSPESAEKLVNWIKAVMENHFSVFNSKKHSSELIELNKTITFRTSTFTNLLKLRSKLDFVLNNSEKFLYEEKEEIPKEKIFSVKLESIKEEIDVNNKTN